MATECQHIFEHRRDAEGPYKRCIHCGEEHDLPVVGLYHALVEATGGRS